MGGSAGLILIVVAALPAALIVALVNAPVVALAGSSVVFIYGGAWLFFSAATIIHQIAAILLIGSGIAFAGLAGVVSAVTKSLAEVRREMANAPAETARALIATIDARAKRNAE